MGMKVWKDSTGFEWHVNPTALAIHLALKEMDHDMTVCIEKHQEEFALTLFWHSISGEAKRNGLTREQVETDYIQPEDLFFGGSFMNFMTDMINEIVEKNFSKKESTENPQPEANR